VGTAGATVYNYGTPGLPDRRPDRASGTLARVLSSLLDLLLPVDCGGCGVPGPALCAECARSLGAAVRVYPPGCAAGPPVYALGTYRGPLRCALLAYKERGRRDLAAPLGAALSGALLPCGPHGLGYGWYRCPREERRRLGVGGSMSSCWQCGRRKRWRQRGWPRR
jgi:hypothetical protein